MNAVDRHAPVPEAPEVERQLVADMLRRGVWFLPGIIVVATLIWGAKGAGSAAVAAGVVAVNLVLAAAGLSWAAKKSLTAIQVMAFAGFAARMGLVVVVLLLVRHQPWINLTALGVTVLVTHLGLLFWELRFVSASLAFPGLKPVAHKEEAVQ